MNRHLHSASLLPQRTPAKQLLREGPVRVRPLVRPAHQLTKSRPLYCLRLRRIQVSPEQGAAVDGRRRGYWRFPVFEAVRIDNRLTNWVFTANGRR